MESQRDNSFVSALFNAGITPAMSSEVKKRTRFCNRVSLLFIAMDLVSIPVLYVFAPAVYHQAVISLLFSVSVIVFNRLGLYQTACFVMANSLPVIAAWLNASVMQGGEPPAYSIYAIQISLLLLPFLIYTASERTLLYISLAFSAILMLCTPLFNDWFVSDIDSSVFTSGFLAYQFAFIAIVIIVSGAEVYRSGNSAMMTDNNRLIEALTQTSTENEDNKWRTEGLNRISEILRKDNDNLNKMTSNTLNGVVEYMHAMQGALYVLKSQSGTAPVLELYAAYAASGIKQRILLGEGMLGQAVLDQKTQILNNVSEDFYKIESSLGNALPASVMVVPLLLGDRAVGVIELLSFRSYTGREIAFAEEFGEAVAISVLNVQFNEQKQELVRQLQNQTEELEAKEEELRANIEDLNRLQLENEEIKLKASRRIKEQIESQRVLMDKTIKRFREREAELEQKLSDAGLK